MAGAHDLGERGEADADQLAFGALLLAAEVGIAELLQREVHGRLVVARVVLEPGGRLVRELVRLDEVLPPEVGRVDPDLVGRRLHEALDQVEASVTRNEQR